MTDITARSIIEELEAVHDFDYRIEHTGGGCATIYINDRILVGPGTFNSQDPYGSLFSWDDFSVGKAEDDNAYIIVKTYAELVSAVERLGGFTKPETILAEADRLVNGPRQADYGHPIEDFTRTGRMWGAILGIPDVPPEKVGLCMVALKISREVNAPKRDNRVDGAGYFGTVQLVREKQGQP